MPDPTFASLDIETYGIASRDHNNEPVPPQNHFHPERCIALDGIPRRRLITTCSLTVPKSPVDVDDRGVPTPKALAAMRPGHTLFFHMHIDEHRMMLRQWLTHLDALLGFNITFDLLMLRSQPSLLPYLNCRHLLLDTQVLNYLHNEQRVERSLKTIGPVLGTHTYNEDETAKSHRFESPFDPKLRSYNCQDTHNTLTSAARLAHRILQDHGPDSLKLSADTVTFYSDLIWSCVQMCESGIPMSPKALEALEATLTASLDQLEQEATASSLLLHGKGVHKSQAAFVAHIIKVLNGEPSTWPADPVASDPPSAPLTPPSSSQGTLFSSPSTPSTPQHSTPTSSSAPTSAASTTHPEPSTSPHRIARSVDVLDHPLLKLTPKQKKIAFSTDNRRLFTALLRDSDHPAAPDCLRLLSVVSRHAESSKLISSYIRPLLRHGSTPDDVRSKLIPSTLGDVMLGFPSVFIVPGAYKDSGDEGGQLQGRISVKNPAGQTFPPDIKACMASRYGDMGCIFSLDLSQVELRVAGILSGDPFFTLEYAKPKPDLHGRMAVDAMGPHVTSDPGWRSGDRRTDPRQWGKELNFWNLYLGGIRQGQATLLKRTGRVFSWDFFRQVADARPHRTPLLWEWQQRLLRTAESSGIITLPVYGVSRYFTGFKLNARREDDEGKSLMNEIVNFPVQFFAAATTHRIMHHVLKATRRLSSVRFFLHVHDALYFDLPRRLVPDLEAIFADAVHHVANNDVWARLVEHTGHYVPLVFETTLKEPKAPALHPASAPTPLPVPA